MELSLRKPDVVDKCTHPTSQLSGVAQTPTHGNANGSAHPPTIMQLEVLTHPPCDTYVQLQGPIYPTTDTVGGITVMPAFCRVKWEGE